MTLLLDQSTHTYTHKHTKLYILLLMLYILKATHDCFLNISLTRLTQIIINLKMSGLNNTHIYQR